MALGKVRFLDCKYSTSLHAVLAWQKACQAICGLFDQTSDAIAPSIGISRNLHVVQEHGGNVQKANKLLAIWSTAICVGPVRHTTNALTKSQMLKTLTENLGSQVASG